MPTLPFRSHADLIADRRLSLAATEKRLRDAGYEQEQIDDTLAFVIEARKHFDLRKRRGRADDEVKH